MSSAEKRRVYEQLSRIGKALAASGRLELLDLLGQAERSVEVLAELSGLSVANTSRHLQVLLAAHLVETRREGQRIVYRLADPSVEALFLALRHTADARLAELDAVARDYLVGRDELEPIDRNELRRRMQSRTVTLIDVRPRVEYEQGHLPGAVSVPLADVRDWARSAPRGKPVVAYCRGPYCVYALEAVAWLRKRGFKAKRSEDGVLEWRAAGLPVERANPPR